MNRVELEITPKTAGHLDVIKVAVATGDNERRGSAHVCG